MYTKKNMKTFSLNNKSKYRAADFSLIGEEIGAIQSRQFPAQITRVFDKVNTILLSF
jgi:hypothetical protein